MAVSNRCNPFENDIVADPRNIERAVMDLNDHAYNQLVQKTQVMVMGPPPRMRKTSHASLVVSPHAGYGKTHLLGRLFHTLRHNANLVNIRPFEDNTACWRNILIKTIQDLLFPEAIEPEAAAEFPAPSQMESFGHRLTLFLLKGLIPDNGTDQKRHQAFLQKVDRVSHRRFVENEVNQKWLFSRTQELAFKFKALLNQHHVQLHASPISWINVFLRAAYGSSQAILQEACHEWLQGNAIDDQEARTIGIRPKDRIRKQAGIGELDEICKHRILDLCHIAGFVRPFVFCFDQTDNYAGDRYLSRALGAVIQVLVDTAPNQMTLVTANQDTWEGRVEPYLAQSHLDRFSDPIELQGLNRQQGWALIRQRLDHASDERSPLAPADVESWLRELFAAGGQLGARDFLRQCRRRWEVESGQTGTPKRELKAYFEDALSEVRHHPRRLRYDPNTFFWLIHKAATGLADLNIQTQRSRVGYFSVSWKYKEQVLMFGFESGGDAERWQSIVDAGQAFYSQNPYLKAVYFRTPELERLPKEAWGETQDTFLKACHTFLDVIQISQPEMVDLYALHDLYIAAMEGDIPYDGKEVLSFLQQRIKQFYRRVLRPIEVSTEDFIPSAVVDRPEASKGPKPSPSMTIEEEVLQIVERERVISLADLKSQITVSKEISDLTQKIGGMESLMRYPHATDQHTVILWQSRS